MTDADNQIIQSMCRAFRGDYDIERSEASATGRGTTEEDRRRIWFLMENIYKSAIKQHIGKTDD